MKRSRKYRKDLNGHVSINKIKGCHYLYFHYYDEDGKKRSEYLGPVSLQSYIRAKERQISYLQEVGAHLDLRLGELRSELTELERQREVARKIESSKVKDVDS